MNAVVNNLNFKIELNNLVQKLESTILNDDFARRSFKECLRSSRELNAVAILARLGFDTENDIAKEIGLIVGHLITKQFGTQDSMQHITFANGLSTSKKINSDLRFTLIVNAKTQMDFVMSIKKGIQHLKLGRNQAINVGSLYLDMNDFGKASDSVRAKWIREYYHRKEPIDYLFESEEL